MGMKDEITGVSRIYLEGGVTAALIKCDKTAALERFFFAFNNSQVDCDTGIKLHPDFSSARIEFFADEPAGLSCGPWTIFVCSEHEGVVVSKLDEYWGDAAMPVDLENEWIDVLAIVRNFFALDRAESWNWEKFL